MFPENLVQACFQQIQTVYKLKKRKNSTIAQVTTTTGYEQDYHYDHERYEIDAYSDYEPTTAVIRNLSGVAEDTWERSLKYADGINVLG